MSNVVVKKRNRNLLPTMVSDFFNTDRFFAPSVFGLEDGFFNLDNSFILPEANIIENHKDYKIELAAPGLKKSDFKVEVQNGVLSISVEKQEEKNEEKENYQRREFSYNSFCRSFTLPENLVDDKIDAKYENGILSLSLPKKEVTVSKPAKQIKVS